MKIEKRSFDEIQGACITWQTRLVEEGPANADDDLQVLTAEILTHCGNMIFVLDRVFWHIPRPCL